MSDSEKAAGCGVVLAHGTPGEVQCGQVDPYGVRQYCHLCNSRLYRARHEEVSRG